MVPNRAYRLIYSTLVGSLLSITGCSLFFFYETKFRPCAIFTPRESWDHAMNKAIVFMIMQKLIYVRTKTLRWIKNGYNTIINAMVSTTLWLLLLKFSENTEHLKNINFGRLKDLAVLLTYVFFLFCWHCWLAEGNWPS